MIAHLAELARLFLKLGTISFGGPAAHIALMEDEVVARRGWLTREQFVDLLGVTHLLPGPNALEMVAHVGYRRAGLLGSVLAGVSFTLPAAASLFGADEILTLLTGTLIGALLLRCTRPGTVPDDAMCDPPGTAAGLALWRWKLPAA